MTMQIIAPVFAPGAEITADVEELAGQAMRRILGTVRPNYRAMSEQPMNQREVQTLGRRAEVKKLHAEGYDNAEIARALHAGPNTIKHDLYRMGLKANPSRATGVTPYHLAETAKREERLAYVDAHFTDCTQAIANHLGVAEGTVKDYRTVIRKRRREEAQRMRATTPLDDAHPCQETTREGA